MHTTNYIRQSRDLHVESPAAKMALGCTDIASFIKAASKLASVICLVVTVAAVCLGNDVKRPILCACFAGFIWFVTKKCFEDLDYAARGIITYHENNLERVEVRTAQPKQKIA